MKTIFKTVIVAILAFSSIAANAAYRMNITDNAQIAINESETSAVLFTSGGDAMRFNRIDTGSSEIDNYGNEYSFNTYLSRDGNAMIGVKIYKGENQVETFLSLKNIKTGKFETINDTIFKTSDVLATNNN